MKVTSQVGPCAWVPVWVLCKGLTGAQVATYVALRSFADRDGECHPTSAMLAKRAGHAVGTVRNSVQRLRRLGLLTTSPIHRRDGSLDGWEYHLVDIDPGGQSLTDPSQPADGPGNENQPPPGVHQPVQGGTPAGVEGYTEQCTRVHPAVDPSTHHTSHQEKEPPPPPPPRSAAASETVDAATRAGVEEPSDSQALSRLVAEIHQVQPGWRPDRIRRALTDAVAQGRAAPVVAEAMRLVAADPHTRSPQRLHEDGDWWTRAARALRHNDGSPRRPSRPCRTHWGQDEEHCSGCRADALAAPDDHGGDAAAPALPRPDAAAEARRKVSRSRLYGTTRHRETRGPHQAGELLGGLLKGSDGRPVGHPTTL